MPMPMTTRADVTLRRLRPLGFALAWLVLLELTLRLCLPEDARVLRDPQHPHGCFADDEQARLLLARAAPAPSAPPPVDLVLVGDSVLGSVNNPAGERLADHLGAAVQAELGRGAPPVRVFTLAAGGARAADVYGAVRRLHAQLGGRTARLFLVANTNVIFFSRRHRQPALLSACLAPALGDDLDPGLRARLQLPAPPALAPVEARLAAFFARHLYLYQQRRRIGELVFGGPPREALRDRLTHAFTRLHGKRTAAPGNGNENEGEIGAAADAERNLPWTARGLHAAQYAPSFDLIPPGTPDAVNFALTEQLAAFLGARARELPSLVVLTPQNHALLGPLAAGLRYDALGEALAAAFARAGVAYVSYDRDPALRSEHFTDLDHLTAAGNRALAARLARDVAARLRAEGLAPAPEPR